MYSHKVFAIYDCKAKAFLTPFFARNSAIALRMFERGANEENTDFHRFAADYTLFEIGEWNETEGELLMYQAKVSLGVAIEFLKVGGV